MKQLNTLYYLLFVLLIMGAFASMAQNDYGITILGLVASAFALVFLSQLYAEIGRSQSKWMRRAELICLFLLSSVMAMRVFHFHFQYVELIFGAAGISLMTIYLRKVFSALVSLRKHGMVWALLIVGFYVSIVLYVLSMVAVALFPPVSEPSGMIAFGLLLLFIAGSIVNRNMLIDGEKVTSIQWLGKSNDSSMVLMTLFLIFSLYLGLTKINLLPKMYSDEYPQAYYELINKAESGKDRPVNGKYRHEQFKAAYDSFVKRNAAEK